MKTLKTLLITLALTLAFVSNIYSETITIPKQHYGFYILQTTKYYERGEKFDGDYDCSDDNKHPKFFMMNVYYFDQKYFSEEIRHTYNEMTITSKSPKNDLVTFDKDKYYGEWYLINIKRTGADGNDYEVRDKFMASFSKNSLTTIETVYETAFKGLVVKKFKKVTVSKILETNKDVLPKQNLNMPEDGMFYKEITK